MDCTTIGFKQPNAIGKNLHVDKQFPPDGIRL